MYLKSGRIVPLDKAYLIFTSQISQGIMNKTYDVRLRAIAEMYDLKTRVGLNEKLARRDLLLFNHNGLVLVGESLDMYRRRIVDEESLLQVLHEMEKNNVRFGMQYLGTPTEQMIGLDAGCGAGAASLMIHREYGCQMEGFTLSKEQVKYANAAAEHHGYSEKVKFSVGNMLKLDKPDELYDFIWACESTEHAPDLLTMFREFARVGKPSSRLVIIAATAHNPESKMRVDEHYLTDFHSPEDYVEAARQSGWSSVAYVDLTPMTTPYWDLRRSSENATGIENFIYTNLINGSFRYHLFAFDLT